MRVPKTKYTVPVKRVTSAHELRTGNGDESKNVPQQSASAPLLTSQNITVSIITYYYLLAVHDVIYTYNAHGLVIEGPTVTVQ